MSNIETTKTYITSVKVTTQTYDLYQYKFDWADGTATDYVLRSPKDSSKYWRGEPTGKPGEYYFQTLMGTTLKRGGNKVIFFIAGDTITRVK